jgi:hypothetical protein
MSKLLLAGTASLSVAVEVVKQIRFAEVQPVWVHLSLRQVQHLHWLPSQPHAAYINS